MDEELCPFTLLVLGHPIHGSQTCAAPVHPATVSEIGVSIQICLEDFFSIVFCISIGFYNLSPSSSQCSLSPEGRDLLHSSHLFSVSHLCMFVVMLRSPRLQKVFCMCTKKQQEKIFHFFYCCFKSVKFKSLGKITISLESLGRI